MSHHGIFHLLRQLSGKWQQVHEPSHNCTWPMNLIQAYRTPENITVKQSDSTLLSFSATASLPAPFPTPQSMKCLLQLRLTDTFPDWTVWIPGTVSDQFIPSLPVCSFCLVLDIYLKSCCKLSKVFQSFRFCFEKCLICITYFLAALLWPSSTLLSLKFII